MAKAHKLKSGSWNCVVYSHTETIMQPDGTKKEKRIYKSFTCDIPGPRGKRTCEAMAAEWAENKETELKKKKYNVDNMTLRETIDKYIQSRERLNRSPTTVQEYKCTAKFGFAGIMDMKIADLDESTLQAAIDLETQRKPLKKGKNEDKPISAKRLRNEWGLIAAVLKKYRPGFYYSVELPAVTQRVPDLLPAKTVFEVVKGTDIELAVLLAAWLSFSLSEVRGLTKSKSINGDYIRIAEVVVDVGGEAVRKDMAKNPTRNRTHRIPKYTKKLIDKTEGDVLVPFDGWEIYKK